MSHPDNGILGIIRWAVSMTVPALAGLCGVVIGAWLTSRREKEARKLSFLQQQLTGFYSPMVGIRNDIRTLSELRLKISQSADKIWPRLCEKAREQGGPQGLEALRQARAKDFTDIIQYNNKQLTESLIPSYRRMVEVFRENYYLAEPETRGYFQDLIEFVNLWDRWLERTIPSEVAEELDKGETPLHPFYEHIEKMHDILRLRLKQGKA